MIKVFIALFIYCISFAAQPYPEWRENVKADSKDAYYMQAQRLMLLDYTTICWQTVIISINVDPIVKMLLGIDTTVILYTVGLLAEL